MEQAFGAAVNQEMALGAKKMAVITGGHGALALALCEELRARHYEVLAPCREELDVTKPGRIREFFAGVSKLDLLINNAGCRQDKLISAMTEEEFGSVISTNLTGAFHASTAAFRIMQTEGHGHIINIGSFSALSGPAGQANYTASKSGLIALTQSLAREFGPSNVRVNCILPGWLETKFSEDVKPETKSAALEAHVLGRFNTTEEAARAIVFLDSLENMSGQVVSFDSRIIPIL